MVTFGYEVGLLGWVAAILFRVVVLIGLVKLIKYVYENNI